MQVHVSPTIPDDDLPVRMNPGGDDPFGIIEFGDAELIIESDADAERVIKAAAMSIAMRKMLGTPHPFESSTYPGAVHGHCTVCGMLKHWEDHAEPVITDSGRTCDQANPGSGAWCHRGGDHGVHEDTDGEKWRTDGGEAGTIDPEYPKPGSRIPPELNYGMDGYVVGDCGHRVAGSEWRAGFRTCENCGINGDFEDDGEPEPSVTA